MRSQPHLSALFLNFIHSSYFSATFPFEQANDEEFYATWPSFQSPSSAYAEITQDSVTTAETFLTREDFNGPGSLLPPHPDDANRQVEWDLIAGHFPPEDEPAPLFTTVNPAVLSPPLLLPTTSSKSASKTKKTQGRGSRAGRRDRALPVSAVLLDAAPPSKNITGHDVGSAPAVVVSPQAAERRLEGDAEPSIALPADDAQGTKKRKRGEEEKEKEAVFVAAPDVVIIAPANMTAEQKKALNAMRTHVVVEALSGNAEKRGMTRKDLDTFVRMYQDLNLPETAWDYTVRTEFIRTYYGALFSQYMRVVVRSSLSLIRFHY